MELQSRFGRVAANIEKMGAYFTEPGHCKDIAKMLVWPEDGKVSVLEPSAGDGVAVRTICSGHENASIFAVELNKGTYEEHLKGSEDIECAICADFLTGVKIQHNAFSLMFGNPPYLDDSLVTMGRNEKSFIEKANQYLTRNAVVIWVVSVRTMKDGTFKKFWIGHYDTLALYKFREEEYNKYKQYVVIGRKITRKTVSKEMEEAWDAQVDEALELPENPPEEIEIYPSDPDEIKTFAAKKFDEIEAFETLMAADGNGKSKVVEWAAKRMRQPQFTSGELERPPIPVKKDTKYLLAVSGAGQGMAGEIGKDLHLQRGVAKVVDTVTVEAKDEDDPNGDCVDRVVSSTKISMAVIETSGKISRLL